MVFYKYAHFLRESNHQAFDQVFEAAIQTPYSGIYRCEGCGKCVTSVKGYPLPPQNHHQHTIQQGLIRWKLVASHE